MTTETNAERLMRIKKHWHKYDTDVTQTDFWWLIQQAEQVQELEAFCSKSANFINQVELEKENARLREALEFYADFYKYNYGGSIILQDAGNKARQALEGST